MSIPMVLDIPVEGFEQDFYLRELERLMRWMSHLPVGRYELLLFPHELYVGEVEARIAALKITPMTTSPTVPDRLTQELRDEYWEFHSEVTDHEALLRTAYTATGRYSNP